jgi:hypothetical protein
MGALKRFTTMDEVIGHLRTSPTRSIDGLVSDLPEERRAALAVFCYSRSHLYEVALAIAATCDERTLVLAGGRPGTFLFEQSRHSPTSGQSQPGAQRVKISLPTNVSRQILDEELKAAIN